MAGQNINQYVYPNLNPKLALESYDMSLTSDEKGFNMEVIFSPYLIAQTYGNRLPFYFDINSSITNQKFTLNYKEYNRNNIFVSENYYNINNEDLTCYSAQTSCDIGLTGIDNGLVTGMTGYSITFTKGLFSDGLKFDLDIETNALLCPNPNEFYSRAYLTADVADTYRALPSIKSRARIANVAFGSILQASTCNFSAPTDTLDAIDIDVCAFSAMAQICQFDLEQSFVALQMTQGSNGDFTVASFLPFCV